MVSWLYFFSTRMCYSSLKCLNILDILHFVAYRNHISHCYIAGNFFPTTRALIGYFEVTRHLTMKLFPDKSLSGQRCVTSGGNNALLPTNVDGRPPLQRGLMNFQLQNFQLYNKSLRFSGNKINCFPREQSLSV